jgi:pimeloyl-ACP methyl ester carboxylesterase
MASRWAITIMALIAVAIGLFELRSTGDGLRITRTVIDETPVTIFQPDETAAAPVVVIAHGFAGSQQLMQPFAETFARNGYIAVTFDFLGHGRNPVPMHGDVTEGKAITSALLEQLGRIVGFARTLPGGDGRIAVLGHSMASDIVVRFAQANPDIRATVAVSVFSPVVTATSPRNLLVIVGSLEPSMLRNEGLRIVGLSAGANAAAGESYGNFAEGTARRLVLARGVEHIGVLYSHDSLSESLQWMNAAFGRRQAGFIDSRGHWLGLVFLGVIAMAWPLSSLLPVATEVPVGANLAWTPLIITAVVPAILTPLILWKIPTDFLPILLGDYLTLHFLLYAALTLALLLLLNWPRRRRATMASWKAILAATAAVTVYNITAFGLPIDAYVFSFLPIPSRLPLIAAIVCGTLPYFIVDEWLTRGADLKRGAYALTKFCFLLSLAAAVALNPMKLFFLVIIVPAILLLFLAFGMISRWSYLATRHPLPGAIANAAVFAWAIGVAFPMITR